MTRREEQEGDEGQGPRWRPARARPRRGETTDTKADGKRLKSDTIHSAEAKRVYTLCPGGRASKQRGIAERKINPQIIALIPNYRR